MPNDEVRTMIDLIITELEELAFILAQVRDQHPVEAASRIDGSHARCSPAPVIIINPQPCPMPDPLPDCHEFSSLPAVAVLQAVEQLLGAQVLAVRRLCELCEPAGPTPS
jgi:hypothetical protein